MTATNSNIVIQKYCHIQSKLAIPLQSWKNNFQHSGMKKYKFLATINKITSQDTIKNKNPKSYF